MLSQITLLSIASNMCPDVQLQTNPPVNLTEYSRASWYIQQQQVNGYQRPEDLYCVVATYNFDNYSHVPLFSGRVLSVYNYANFNSTNGSSINNSTVLCARQPNSSHPERLLVAPCFLPNFFGGPYWIMAAGPNSTRYEWAVVIGGQPTVRTGNYTCTTRMEGFNNAGLWIFSRNQTMNTSTLNHVRSIIANHNISTDHLLNVTQEGCSYRDIFIKPNH
jgi:hypothetical protein